MYICTCIYIDIHIYICMYICICIGLPRPIPKCHTSKGYCTKRGLEVVASVQRKAAH